MEQTGTESTIVSNAFGVVTSKRVIYQRKKGWFAGGSREDIPLKHVTAVRLEISRSIPAGIVIFLIGLGMLFGEVATFGKLFGVGLLALAALLFWGSPAIVVNTSGQDLQASKGTPWQRAEANSFVEALRAQIFRD